jgi:hypothetical protein
MGSYDETVCLVVSGIGAQLPQVKQFFHRSSSSKVIGTAKYVGAMNFKTHAPARKEGTTLQPNIHKINAFLNSKRTVPHSPYN